MWVSLPYVGSTPQRGATSWATTPEVGAVSISPGVHLRTPRRLGSWCGATSRPSPTGGVSWAWCGWGSLALVGGLSHHLLHFAVIGKFCQDRRIAQQAIVEISLCLRNGRRVNRLHYSYKYHTLSIFYKGKSRTKLCHLVKEKQQNLVKFLFYQNLYKNTDWYMNNST